MAGCSARQLAGSFPRANCRWWRLLLLVWRDVIILGFSGNLSTSRWPSIDQEGGDFRERPHNIPGPVVFSYFITGPTVKGFWIFCIFYYQLQVQTCRAIFIQFMKEVHPICQEISLSHAQLLCTIILPISRDGRPISLSTYPQVCRSTKDHKIKERPPHRQVDVGPFYDTPLLGY